ncbi:MAG: hypothetical protein IJV85_00085 [Clostridia bacterium]|nr:hypothetical protein [Clostridia bacterium]
MEKFSVTLPLTGEYLTTVRLTTGGLCSLVGFDVDTAEDFKVCVTESLLILRRSGYATANIAFTVAETLGCVVEGVERSGEKQDSIEDEISHSLLTALLGNVEFFEDERGATQRIVFEG